MEGTVAERLSAMQHLMYASHDLKEDVPWKTHQHLMNGSTIASVVVSPPRCIRIHQAWQWKTELKCTETLC